MKIVTATLNPALDVSTTTGTIRPGPKLRCTTPDHDAGGGGINVSRAIRKLGGESLALAAIGGANGEAVAALLRAEGVEMRAFGPRHDTRMSLSATDDTGAQYRFVLPGPAWSAEDCDAARADLVAQVDANALLVASGSQPSGTPADFFLRLAEDLRAKNVHLLLDTSGAALHAATRGPTAIHILRMDRAEGEEVAGHALPSPAEVAALARRLQADGVAEIVCVACGAQGNVVASAAGAALCTAPPRTVVSTVGAGDSFVGGFSLATARGADPFDACARGSAAAASAVTTPATQLVDPELAEEFYRGIAVSHL